MSAATPKTSAPETEKKEKVIPLSEIQKHQSLDDLWMAINGKVYDITNFVDQHPGGEEVLLENAGRDATGPFDDVGHSENAVEMLAEYYVGEGNPEELKLSAKKETTVSENGGGSNNTLIIVCIIVAVCAFFYYKSLQD